MPRQARLDTPGALHHGMVRGLERRVIFRDDSDRADFVARLAALAEAGALTVYAWALLPKHAHLLGVSPQAVYQAVARGCVDRARWERLLEADT